MWEQVWMVSTQQREGIQRTPGKLNLRTEDSFPSSLDFDSPITPFSPSAPAQLSAKSVSASRACWDSSQQEPLPVPPGVDLSTSQEPRKVQGHYWASPVHCRVVTAHGKSSKLLSLPPTSLHVPRRLKMTATISPSHSLSGFWGVGEFTRANTNSAH